MIDFLALNPLTTMSTAEISALLMTVTYAFCAITQLLTNKVNLAIAYGVGFMVMLLATVYLTSDTGPTTSTLRFLTISLVFATMACTLFDVYILVQRARENVCTEHKLTKFIDVTDSLMRIAATLVVSLTISYSVTSDQIFKMADNLTVIMMAVFVITLVPNSIACVMQLVKRFRADRKAKRDAISIALEDIEPKTDKLPVQLDKRGH